MRKKNGELMRQLAAAIFLSALAIAAMLGAIGTSRAADLPDGQVVNACGEPQEDVILFDELGAPTRPARTPYFTCITGITLLPGEIPPPPEYCCH
jgi:hypothetical protein